VAAAARARAVAIGIKREILMVSVSFLYEERCYGLETLVPGLGPLTPERRKRAKPTLKIEKHARSKKEAYPRHFVKIHERSDRRPSGDLQ
jgi:hypothetical protein